MYVVRVETILGDLFFGPYQTLDQAREFVGSKRRFAIFTVWGDLGKTASDIEAMTTNEIRDVLDANPDY